MSAGFFCAIAALTLHFFVYFCHLIVNTTIMKLTKLLIAFIAAAPLCISAQNIKIATVNIQDVYNAMPDKALADKQLKATSDQFKAEYDAMKEEFNKKFADYQAIAGDETVPATIKERRMMEIQENDKKIQAFLVQADKDVKKLEQDLKEPIMKKINIALEDIGVEGHYTYIFDTSKTPLAYQGEGAVDLTADLKQRLLESR